MPLDLFTLDAGALLLVSLGVGVVVGLTGMGGGALMTPALIFLGIPPTAAVANDLVAAAVNKSVGAAVHVRHGSPHLRLAGLLAISSVPFAFSGAFIVRALGGGQDGEEFVKVAIGCALVFTAFTFSVRIYLGMRAFAAGRDVTGDQDDIPLRVVPTLIVGALGGTLVGITSVGAGSLIMVALLLLYPTLAARRLVGTDLVQAIPLVVSAAISHVIVTGVTWSILIPLIVGGVPGTYLGARIAAWVPQGIIRRGIAIVLSLTGLALLGVPPTWVGLIGGGALILGPLAWAGLRVAHGLPAVDPATYTVSRDHD
ncbi:MAG: sulfite exporter TauE/SafE family protein [Ornithinimicrobium sp.]